MEVQSVSLHNDPTWHKTLREIELCEEISSLLIHYNDFHWKDDNDCDDMKMQSISYSML